MLETEERQKHVLLELEVQQDEKRRQEADDIKALLEEQKQLQQHTTCLLYTSRIPSTTVMILPTMRGVEGSVMIQ